MKIDEIRANRAKLLNSKTIKPLIEKLKNLKKFDNLQIELKDSIKIDGKISKDDIEEIKNLAIELKPWRKGPFELFNTFIDTEWRSYLKYNLLEPHFDLEDKKVADIGCNNGYYLFKMLEQKPKKLVGFDPSAIYKTQFDFINHFIKSEIEYELLGIEDLPFYEYKFDTIFCLGVLYHRSDPVKSLKNLAQGLNKNGELFLDTFMIDGEEEIALSPESSYSKIPNIYFVPTVNTLKNWLKRAKFADIKVIDIVKTTNEEQRSTDWILGESLDDFLDKDNPNLTIEGYPAPKRVYIKARRI